MSSEISRLNTVFPEPKRKEILKEAISLSWFNTISITEDKQRKSAFFDFLNVNFSEKEIKKLLKEKPKAKEVKMPVVEAKPVAKESNVPLVSSYMMLVGVLMPLLVFLYVIGAIIYAISSLLVHNTKPDKIAFLSSLFGAIMSYVLDYILGTIFPGVEIYVFRQMLGMFAIFCVISVAYILIKYKRSA